MTSNRNLLWAISFAAFCIVATVAGAADNSSVPVAVGNETFANKDIGGVKFPKHILYNSSGTEVGTAAAPLFMQSASGAFASGSFASGAFASGAFASGSMAAGSHAAGAGVDGWDLTQGAIADASVSAGATGSISAKLRRISTDIGTVATNSALPLPVQTGIGNVNIGAVQSAGSAYETVAASQTAQALGATGATGDYLSHCVIYPASTSPGVVTVFDNANAAATNVIAFAGGATSTSNLTPISVPVGALSTAGAWKVTTGANVSVACFGKFT